MKHLYLFENFEDYFSYQDVDANCFYEEDDTGNETGFCHWVMDEEIEDLKNQGFIKGSELAYTLRKYREKIENYLELRRSAKKYNI